MGIDCLKCPKPISLSLFLEVSVSVMSKTQQGAFMQIH